MELYLYAFAFFICLLKYNYNLVVYTQSLGIWVEWVFHLRWLDIVMLTNKDGMRQPTQIFLYISLQQIDM